MHATPAIIASLAMIASAFPITTEDIRRGLLNLSPIISPSLSASPGCLGIGISVCNPINVKGNQNTGSGGSPTKQQQPQSSNGDYLVNVAPNVSPNVGIGGGCTGIGISACDPINVKGNQNTGA
jgi:hypothetical protein